MTREAFRYGRGECEGPVRGAVPRALREAVGGRFTGGSARGSGRSGRTRRRSKTEVERRRDDRQRELRRQSRNFNLSTTYKTI